MKSNNEAQLSRRLVTVREMLEANPFLTNGWLRDQLFRREQNRLAECVVQCGRKLLIDVDMFEEWLYRQEAPHDRR